MADNEKSLTERAINIYTGGGGAGSTIAVIAVVGIAGITGYLLWKKFGKKQTVWQPVLSAIVNSSSLTASPSLSVGWAPALSALVNSPTLTATLSLSAGWQAVLLSVVNSPTLTATVISMGWQPVLLAVVSSPTLAVTPGATPTLEITNPNIYQGEILHFAFSGFTPNSQVWVGVAGGGGLYITANSSGAGGGSFVVGEGAGTYTLFASDGTHYTTHQFTVTVLSLIYGFFISPMLGDYPAGKYWWANIGGYYANFLSMTEPWTYDYDMGAGVTGTLYLELYDSNFNLIYSKAWANITITNGQAYELYPTTGLVYIGQKA